MTSKQPAKSDKTKLFPLSDSDIISKPSTGRATSAHGSGTGQPHKAADPDAQSYSDVPEAGQAMPKPRPGRSPDRN